MMRDYYEILGVERAATVEVIKKAYRRLALQYHPDRNPGDKAAEEKFKECTEAYGVLSDPDKRARYDQFGHAGLRGGAGQPDFSSIFDQFRDIFGAGGSAFEDLFGGQQRRGPRRGRPGSDLRIKLPLTLEEIALGVDKKVRVRKFMPCDVCGGAGAEGGDAGFETCSTCAGAGEVRQVARSLLGQFVSVQPCPTCGGEGRLPRTPCRACNGEGRRRAEEEIPISVPPGVLEGHYLTLRGAGNAGMRGGEPGDLRVEIEETPHAHFRREGLDIVHDLFLSVPDALLGTEADVPTLEGTATIKIEPGTPGGKVLRLRGRGLPELGGRGQGDELVRINVWMPPKLTPEEQALVERLRDAPSFQERPPHSGGNGKSFFERVKDVFS
ncbi:MAG TPA: molecular chaperone DnaJ [Rhodothermales bacterium]|nr:molecular chaperone DnaJ [Rhodothermales bacterium]